jgi:hypothetical protein
MGENENIAFSSLFSKMECSIFSYREVLLSSGKIFPVQGENGLDLLSGIGLNE